MAANFWDSRQAASLSVSDKGQQYRDKGLTVQQSDKIIFFHIHYIQQLVAYVSNSGGRHRVATTASVFFRRIYQRCKFSDADPRSIAPATVYLAAKIEEVYLPMKVIFHAMSRLSAKFSAIPPLDVKKLADLEMVVMEKLGFLLLVWHPEPDLHDFLSDTCRAHLAKHAWAVMNDSYHTPVLLQYAPHIVALSCIVIASIFQGTDVQDWLGSLEVDLDQVNEAVDIITRFYEDVPRASSQEIRQIMAKVHLSSN